jgi:hypothetical protein
VRQGPRRWRSRFLLAIPLVCASTEALASSHLVADTSTPIRGMTGTLHQFGIPAFNGRLVTFSADRGAVGGVYADAFDGVPEVQKLVEVNDPTPDGKTFGQLFPPALDGSGGPAIAIFAQTCCSSPSSGLYEYQGGTGSVITSPSHCGSETDGLVVDGTTVLCVGSDGIDAFAPGIGQTIRVSNTASGVSTPITFFPEITFDPVSGIAARAQWPTGPDGVLAQGVVFAPAGSTSANVLVDTETTVPNTSEKFVSFGQPALDGFGNIVFAGQGSTRQGIYRYRAGALDVIADTSMVDPVTHGTFSLLRSPVLDEGAVLFFGGEGTLSTTLFRADGSGLHALYSGCADVPFDDGRSRSLCLGATYVRPMAIANHRLAMLTGFADETGAEAIVLLDVGPSGADAGTGEPEPDAGTGGNGGEPRHDAGTTTPARTSAPSGQGCTGGPLPAFAPICLLGLGLSALRARGGKVRSRALGDS